MKSLPFSGNPYLFSTGHPDVFVEKLDSNGNFLWVRSISSIEVEFGYSISTKANSITTDAKDNVYITGYFNGTVDFDPGQGVYELTPTGESDIFIEKLTPNGAFIWAKSIGGESYESGRYITTDISDNVYVSGHFNETADFDPGSGNYDLSSEGETDIFVEKLDSDGNFLWAKSMGGIGYDAGGSITTDNLGNVYLSGGFTETVDFDPGSGTHNLTSAREFGFYILKFGQLRTCKKITVTNHDIFS